MLIRPIGSVVIFMPPLAATHDELLEMLDMLYEAFEDAVGELQELAGRGSGSRYKK